MNWLGDFNCGQTVYCWFNTNAGDGSSVTFTGTTVEVYINGSNAQITTGVTLDKDVDGVTGVHRITIVTTDPAYVSGGQFAIMLPGATIDGKTVNHCVGKFSLNVDLNKHNAALGHKKVWYVAPQGGSDSRAGVSPETAFATIGAANTASARGDTIVLLPAGDGSQTFHTVSAGTTFKEGITLLGISPETSRIVLTGSGSYLAGSIRLTIRNVGIDGTGSTSGMGAIFFSGTSTRTIYRLEHCEVRHAVYAVMFHSSSSNQILFAENCLLEGGATGIFQTGSGLNIVRLVHSLARADNSIAVSPNSGNVAGIYGTGGQFYVVDSDVSAVSWSSTLSDTLDAVNLEVSSVAIFQMAGGSLSKVAVAAALTTQRLVRASGGACTVRLGAVASAEDSSLFVEAAGGVIERLGAVVVPGTLAEATFDPTAWGELTAGGGGATAEEVVDELFVRTVGKKPDETDLPFGEAIHVIFCGVVCTQVPGAAGVVHTKSGDGAENVITGVCTNTERTLQSINVGYPFA